MSNKKFSRGIPANVPSDVKEFDKKINTQASTSISNNGASVFIIVMVLVVIGFIGFIVLNNSGNTQANSTPNTTAATTVNGQQIISMTAQATGYTPNIITAKANTATTLRVDATNDFGCTSGMRIPSLGISKNLSGVTDIALGAQAPGTTLNGTCSMGMYNFQIKFS